MIGKIVRYKHRDILDKLGIEQDKTEYIVIDFSPSTNEYNAEIAIVKEFIYDGGIKKQLWMWQDLELFDVIN